MHGPRRLAARDPRAGPRQLGGARRVAVDAEGIDSKRQRRPIGRRHLAARHHAQSALQHHLGVGDDRTGRGSRRERTIGHARDRQSLPRQPAGPPPHLREAVLNSAARRGSRPIECRGCAGNRVGKRAVTRGHVVRAMSLDVRYRNALSRRRTPPARRFDRAPDLRPLAAWP